jgi:hypothetical protein
LCDQTSSLYFNKTILGKYNIDYYKCTNCQSLQTENPFWLEEAYSLDSEKYDTGKASRTLQNFLNLPSLFEIFHINKLDFSIDWGGGGGLLSRFLRDIGYNFYSYDLHLQSEFSQAFKWENQNPKVQLITAFEVIEHFSDPINEFNNIFRLNPDFFICSTDIFKNQDKDWFYLSPDNGQHIFFYSEMALALIAQKFGYTAYNLG